MNAHAPEPPGGAASVLLAGAPPAPASRPAAVLYAALALGLGWAVRGHFGHEWGAAWAGAIGALAVVAAARRAGWAARMPVLAALGALGWAVGGMMSYGRIVGFGRSTDFLNVYYGLSMLGVVGGLYGFLGGGFLGLGLETSRERAPDWPALLTEMVAGAILSWSLLVAQLEWHMTPPRSELWAACLGAAAALAWHLYRHGFRRALRVAGYAALGAGCGFAFGNFVQTLGGASGLAFNWWNVMEFSLGFFGGLGMAYAVFTCGWPAPAAPGRKANALALLFLLVALPATNLIKAFEVEAFRGRAERLGAADPELFVAAQFLLGALALLVFALGAAAAWTRLRHDADRLRDRYVPAFLLAYTALYIFAGHIKKGVFAGVDGPQPEQSLYWVLLALLGGLWWHRRHAPPLLPAGAAGPAEGPPRWSLYVLAFLALAALMAALSIASHDGLDGAQVRF